MGAKAAVKGPPLRITDLGKAHQRGRLIDCWRRRYIAKLRTPTLCFRDNIPAANPIAVRASLTPDIVVMIAKDLITTVYSLRVNVVPL